MTLFFKFLLAIIPILVISWFGWWNAVSMDFTLEYRMGDLLNLWRRFNESMSMAGGVGAVVLLIIGMYKDKKEE